MPRYVAKCYFNNANIGVSEIEVSASSITGAKELLKNVYGARQITNLREIRGNNTSSNDASGYVGLAALAAGAWAFVTFTPWILMLGGGMAAAWLSQFIVGDTLEDAVEEDKVGKIAIILTLTLLAGGFGFVKGTEIQKWINTPDAKIQQTK